jgi:hypothetical protein
MASGKSGGRVCSTLKECSGQCVQWLSVGALESSTPVLQSCLLRTLDIL